MLDTGVISIKKVRVAVVGDKGVGKTSLVQTFKNDEFPQNPIEEPKTTKMFYVGEQRYLFTLVELHDAWEQKRGNLFAVEAVLLCYDGEKEQKARLAEKWTPRIMEWLPTCKVYLVRTKCDRLYENFDDGHNPADIPQLFHAVKAYECSAKEHMGIEQIFKELAEAHDILHPEDKGKVVHSEEIIEQKESKTMSCGLGTTLFSAIASSIPLAKQIGHNLKEIVFNPDCFPGPKETINSFIPFMFYTRPGYDWRRLGEEHKLHEDYLAQIRQDQHEQEQESNDPIKAA